ncbi:hypothetical protein [Janibacter anophelis]|uniref:endonuclease toxin domain-containing protein n=1 Tax=Janibacter anophelis TaxID=319054 RepID=UPI000A629BCB|nr:hypothetical protein [Janibacter anophelis]
MGLPGGDLRDWWAAGVRNGLVAAFPGISGPPLLALEESYRRWQQSDLTWFEGLFVPWLWPEKWRNQYLDVVDESTDWANDVYKNHVRDLPGIGHTRWALHRANDAVEFVDMFVSPLDRAVGGTGVGTAWNIVKDTVNETTEMADDPKGWWDGASGLDQAGAASTLIPAGGFAVKGATKALRELIDVGTGAGKHADDVKSPHLPDTSKTDTVDPHSGPDAHDNGNPNKGDQTDVPGSTTDDGSGPDAHDDGNPNTGGADSDVGDSAAEGDRGSDSAGTPDTSGGSIKDLEDAVNHPDPDDLYDGQYRAEVSGKALRLLDERGVTDLDRVWDDVMPMPRGFVLEATEGGNLPQSFPVIDRVDETADGLDVTSIKSLDPQAVSYNKGNKFENTINDYVDAVAKFDGDAHGGVVVYPSDIGGRHLDLVVRPDSLSEKQTAALDRSIKRAEGMGVNLVVKERP